MKFNLTLLAAAALLAAACAPKAGKTTKVVGQFAENAPETVRIVVGETVDTTVTVTDGRFEVAIPTDLCDVAYVETDYMPVSFIADGSKIPVDPMAGIAVSSNKKGAQAHYAAYNAWMEQFMADYRAKMAEFGEDEEAAQKYFDEVVEKFNAYQKETAKANLDNIVGLMAISEIMDDDTEELKALLDGLSDEMKARPEVARMIASFETLAKTGEGQPFVDFTVVEEPAAPEASTVKFSDYVGNGKFVLVDGLLVRPVPRGDAQSQERVRDLCRSELRYAQCRRGGRVVRDAESGRGAGHHLEPDRERPADPARALRHRRHPACHPLRSGRHDPQAEPPRRGDRRGREGGFGPVDSRSSRE